MEEEYQTPEEALNALKSKFGHTQGIADFLGIHPSHLYNYYYGYREKPSPTLMTALRKKSLIRKRVRSQITWENDNQKQAFIWYVASLGTTLTDYCRDIANSNMEAFKNDKQIHN